MNHDLNPPKSNVPAASQVAATVWPTDGTASFSTLENLAATDGVRSMVLAASVVPAAPATVAKTTNGGGSYATLLLADDALTQLLTSPAKGAAGMFATAQDCSSPAPRCWPSKILASRSSSRRRSGGSHRLVWPPTCWPERPWRRG